MKRKIHTLLVGFGIIAAAAIQTEVNQRLKIKHLKVSPQVALASSREGVAR